MYTFLFNAISLAFYIPVGPDCSDEFDTLLSDVSKVLILSFRLLLFFLRSIFSFLSLSIIDLRSELSATALFFKARSYSVFCLASNLSWFIILFSELSNIFSTSLFDVFLGEFFLLLELFWILILSNYRCFILFSFFLRALLKSCLLLNCCLILDELGLKLSSLLFLNDNLAEFKLHLNCSKCSIFFSFCMISC